MARRGLLAVGVSWLVIVLPAHAAIAPVVTDGVRYAAYQPNASVTRVLDTRRGTSFDVPTPPGCYPRYGDGTGPFYSTGPGSGGVEALGAGRLMWLCEDRALVMDLRTRAIAEPQGADVDAFVRKNGGTFISYVFEDVGTRWIRVLGVGAHQESYPLYLDLATGVLQQPSVGAGDVANLDSQALVQPLCAPLRRGAEGFDVGDRSFVPGYATTSYERPYLITHDGPPKAEESPLYLERCGSAHRTKLASKTEHASGAQLGGGIVTWTTGYGKGVHVRVLRSGRSRILREPDDAAVRVFHTANRVFVSMRRLGSFQWSIHTLHVPGRFGLRPVDHGGTPVTPAS